MKSGMVYFVGAGPGDIDLITVKGKQALQEADVVIFDRLINPFLLTAVRDDAKLIYCGKQPCKHTLRQEDIQKEILIHARKGKTVVRLKGGDPAVFGRVGEEVELLAEHRIAYEIIPGITAGIAATMYSGVPITHRKHSNSFAVVTGHGSKDDGTPNVEWGPLAKGVETIVFYMGVKHLRTITTELIKNGKEKDTAALVVQWGTYSKQRTVEGSLATIANKVKQANITNPAIIVVGDVAKLRSKLAWFDNKQLSGRGVLIPSKTEMNQQLVKSLKVNGADVYEHNLLTQVENIGSEQVNQITQLSKEQQLVFLSTQSVYTFLRALGENDLDLRKIESPIYAIDNAVKATLQMLGIQSSLASICELQSPVLIGGDVEIESMRLEYPKWKEELVLTKHKVSQKDIEAFNRLIEEQHVNTLLVTSSKEAIQLVTFLKLSGIEKDSVINTLNVVCRGIETSLILEAAKIPVKRFREGENIMTVIREEETVLAVES
ncbi:uroporphyrinogen-III C-methyltransferase [Halalkalibacter kiskunsagensis]|uniref:uroporphyrinogen-III C-methyltransferase n=1 Tax=Halalkalibacter kiskunsagensis TaxID=1548599 RepID=A0ABV6KAS4_9BACI